MNTAEERLQKLEAFVDKIAKFQRGGMIRIEDRQLHEHDEMIGEARTLVRFRQQPVDPRFEKVRAGLQTSVSCRIIPPISAPLLSLVVRDVLAALDA